MHAQSALKKGHCEHTAHVRAVFLYLTQCYNARMKKQDAKLMNGTFVVVTILVTIVVAILFVVFRGFLVSTYFGDAGNLSEGVFEEDSDTSENIPPSEPVELTIPVSEEAEDDHLALLDGIVRPGVDCISSFACLESSLRAGWGADAIIEMPPLQSGNMEALRKTYIRITKDGDGNIALLSLILQQSLVFGTDLRREMLSGGMSESNLMNEERIATEKNKGLVGSFQWCAIEDKVQLLGVLNAWGVGEHSSTDLDFAECTTFPGGSAIPK